MTEAEFLDHYDITKFERPSVTIDIVLMSIIDGRLVVLLVPRSDHPFKGTFALPGGFVGIEESVDAAAVRILAQKVGVFDVFMEQLYTFGAVERDPRGRVITVVHLALVQPSVLLQATDNTSVGLATIQLSDPITVTGPNGAALDLGFDHSDILALAIERLQGKLNYLPISLNFFPELFTLRDLQTAHEAILGITLNKPAFRRKILDAGWIEGTGRLEVGTSFRPAELYRRTRV